MLIGTVVTRLDIPHEPGEWVEVRKLSHKTLARAAQARSDAGISSMKTLGAELLTALRQAREELQTVATEKATVESYDRDLVLQAGVVRWSYDAGVTPEALNDLDDATARWLVTEIVTRSVAPISKEALGNVTSPSTGS